MKMQAFSGTNSTPAAGRNDIYKLPVEILIQIFLSAYLTSEPYTRFQLPFKLVLVTSFWRKLVLGEPRLWTYTFYGKGRFEPQPAPPIRSLLFQLSQSGSRPLEITIDLRWRIHKKELIDELIDALLPHKDRWASFSLQSYENGTMVRIMRTIPEELPELRELVLQCQGGFDTGSSPGRLMCPKLQVLRLRGTVLRHQALIASALPSLASVSIANVFLRWNDWSTMLQRGPKLVELDLQDVVIGRGGGVGSTPPVSMPHLKRLALLSLADRYAAIKTTTPDPIIASFFAPQLHTLRLDEGGTSTTPPPNNTWDKSMPVLKTLVIHNKGEIDANVFQRFPHISHINVSDDRTESHFHAMRVLELLADPATGPLLDKLDALTFSTMIPTYEGWEKFLSGKKLRVCIDSVFEIAARKSMDTKNLQDREAAIEKLKAIVPIEICPVPKDITWFSDRWRFGGDN